MSTLEPQTSAKVRLHTTKGPIDIELWAKETPITSRAFLTHSLNGRFNGWEFNRVVTDFLVQVDGLLNQEPFADEFNQRIRFSKRGIIGSVNLGSKRNSNTGKFFITLKETPQLQGRNTAFGKVVGDGIFTVLNISEGELGEDGETPLYPVKITRSEVLIPFFHDLAEEQLQEKEGNPIKDDKNKISKKKKSKAKVKLSLGDEDEDEDQEVSGNIGAIDIKMKSAHDLLNDRRLAKEKVVSDPHHIPTEQEPQHEEPNQPTTDKIQTLPAQSEKERDERLQKVRAEIDKLKGDLNHDHDHDSLITDTSAQHKQEQSIEKQREEYLIKNPQLKLSDKKSKELRETETLKLLEKFQQKVHINTSKSPISETTAIEKEKKNKKKNIEAEDAFDDDFDNLDDSDSNSDSDLYSHQLKFDDNEDNKTVANEDLLITIDDLKQKELKKKRDIDFYQHVESASVLTKKQKKL